MSHNLDATQGQYAIAIAEDSPLPWHGHVRNRFKKGVQYSPDQVCELAGLNYGVKKSGLITYKAELSDGTILDKVADNRVVIYRTDTGDFLSTMSQSHYVPAQPVDMVRELMRLIENVPDFQMESVMALQDGRVISMTARLLGADTEIGKGDKIYPYVNFMTSYDGSYARAASLMHVLPICENTLRMGLSSGETVRQRNTKEFNIESADDLFKRLGLLNEAFKSHVEQLKAMAKIKFSEEQAVAFFAKLYAPEIFATDEDFLKVKNIKERVMDKNKVTTNKQNNIGDLTNLFLNGPGSELSVRRDTLYGALNAVTHYQDHKARTKNDKRFESSQIGAGARKKEAAFDLAMNVLQTA